MNIKKISFSMFMLVCCSLTSCGPNNESKKNNIMDRKITYEELYHDDCSRHEEVEGKATYKASYGYLENSDQGYNNFYYLYKVDSSYFEMTFSEGMWIGDKSYLFNEFMKSTNGEYAVRKFVVPVSGTIKITANPRLVDGNPVALDLYINNDLIDTWLVSDDNGIYQEKTVTVNESDSIYFVNRGAGTIRYNPKIDYDLNPDTLLHTAVDGFYGDIHPFYDFKNKKMYLYYLSTEKQTEIEPVKLYSSLCSSSSDMFHYLDTEISCDEDSKPESTLFYVLGVTEDMDGNYRSCFGVNDHAGASVSKDLLTWSNGAEMFFDEKDNFSYLHRCYFGNIAGCGRDPDIYFEPTTEQYYCIVLTYKATSSKEGASGEKHLSLYKGNSAGLFSPEGKHIIDFTNRGDPECPQVRKINNRWYVFYSIYGTGTAGNVGKLAYRVGDYNVDIFDVDWNNKVEYFLDGGDLHAAQVVNVADKIYMYGWINSVPYTNVWGGYLNLPREIYADESGLLYTRLDEKATNLLQKGVMYNSGNASFNSNTILYSNSPRSMITANITIPEEEEFVGIKIEQYGYSPIEVGLHRQSGKLYLRTFRNGDFTEGTSIVINETNEKQFELKVVLDDMFIEAFINNKYSLTSHVLAQLGGTRNISAKTNNGVGNLNNVLIYRLATLDNIYD